MDSDLQDRMETPKKRTLPKGYDEVKPIVLPDRLPPFICPACGRGQTARILKTNPENRYVECGACAERMLATVRDGKVFCKPCRGG
jgi:transcription elongation factor Elf1